MVVALRSMSSRSTARQSSTAAATAGRPISVKKIDARVFCLGTEGGNPVTIFASPRPLSGSLQQQLAKLCDWESVVVGTEPSSRSSQLLPTMAFFMPSGEEVSFCAHAAIGGAIAMGGGARSWDFRAAMTGDTFTIDTAEVEDEENNNENRTDNDGRCDGAEYNRDGSSSRRRCRLHMNGVRFDEAPLGLDGMTTLKEWSDRLNWSMASTNGAPVSPRNASVARPKTLVRLESVDAVERAETPPGDGSFADACTAMDDSTGVYLYAPILSDPPHKTQNSCHHRMSLECRQFPRSSGYPEDPATGIAAAALAASLRFGNNDDNRIQEEESSIVYDIYQGTAMGRPSLIQVVDLEREDGGTISFGLQGRVEIDETSTIQVSE